MGVEIEDRSRGTSRSSVSRRFVSATAERVGELQSRPLGGERWVIVFVDGFSFADHQLVGALGVIAEGEKVPLAVAEGTTKNKALCTRWWPSSPSVAWTSPGGVLFVVDGSKALSRAIERVFGGKALIQRCRLHKERNVIDHLPASEHSWGRRKLRATWAQADPAEAQRDSRP